MHHSILSLFSLLLVISLQAQSEFNEKQNLVINPSFEMIDNSDSELLLADEIDKATGWTSPSLALPKLYTSDTDGTVYDEYGSSWSFKARSGKNVAAIHVHGNTRSGDEKREYIQGSLATPLQVGKKYNFSFWVHYHCEGANNIGIAFLPNQIKTGKYGLIELEPATFQKEVTPYSTTQTWTQVSGSFIAYKPLKYFIIGNFFSNDNTRLQSQEYNHYMAYIDDIVVAEDVSATEIAQVQNVEEAQKWEANMEAIKDFPVLDKSARLTSGGAIKHLNFEAGSSQLGSTEYLETLAADLKSNQNLRVKITGHASSEGSRSFNQQLSKKRSEAIRNYLLSQGISAGQIIIEAYGENRPVSDNSTEEGRMKNRRVEIERLMGNE